jgi:hypothetical protein
VPRETISSLNLASRTMFLLRGGAGDTRGRTAPGGLDITETRVAAKSSSGRKIGARRQLSDTSSF